nr:hypothetical protein [Pedobacter sp. ASV19]
MSVISLNSFVALGGDPSDPRAVRWLRPRVDLLEKSFIIDDLLPVGTTYQLSRYLKQRKLWTVAGDLLVEVHYRLTCDPDVRYYALGWQNEAGGWVLQNPCWHGLLGPKAITIIPGDGEHVTVFEHYMDDLRWMVAFKRPSHTVIVLNSTDFLDAGIFLCPFFRQAELFYHSERLFRRIHVRYGEQTDYSVNYAELNEGYGNYIEAWKKDRSITKEKN